MRGWLGCLALMSVSVLASAQPGQVWHHTFGGTGWDEGRTIDPATNGGYVVAGSTTSFGNGDRDFYLVRIDEQGNELWHRTYGGAGDEGYEWVEVQRASDGGYFLAGETDSYGAGSYDFYAVKTDSGGNVQWTRTYGGSSIERPRDAIQLKDGGYVIVGYSTTFCSGYADFYVVRTDPAGNPLWTRNYGGSGIEDAHSVVEAPDHGLLIAGYTTSFGSGEADIYLVRTDMYGNVLWTHTYGGASDETIREYVRIRHVPGGYVLATFTDSFGAGRRDAYLLRIDYNGNLLWSQTFGSPEMDDARDVIPTTDGGFLLGGYSYAHDPMGDYYLVKTDGAGNQVWSLCFGSPETDWVYSVQEARDGGYLAVGKTASGSHGGWDMSVFRIESDHFAPPEFNPVDSTGYPYPIIIDGAFIDDQTLEPGDLIGVFDEQLCVGRATVVNWPVTITTWGTDSVHGLPGFGIGDTIRYRVWSRAMDLTLPALPTYVFGDGTFGFEDHSEAILTAASDVTMIVPLRANYAEFVSLNVLPEDLSVEHIFQSVEHLAAVYNDAGGSYWPHSTNTIGDVSLPEAYRVVCTRADTLIVHGRHLNPSLPYTLQGAAWNWIGYPLRTPTPVDLALEPIRTQVVIAQDQDGNVWIPNLGINTLQMMQPGRGYMVWASSEVTFSYTQGLSTASVPRDDHGRRPQVPIRTSPDGAPFTVLVHLSDALGQANPARIELYDQSRCVGYTAIGPSSNPIVVTAWEALPAHHLDGFVAGHQITLRLLDGAQHRINVRETSSPGVYGEGPYAEITLDSDSPVLGGFSVGDASPNPFNPTVSIPFAIAETGTVEFHVFNTLGQLVFQSKGIYSAGEHRFTLDSRDFLVAPGSGMYFVEIRHNREQQLRKALMLR